MTATLPLNFPQVPVIIQYCVDPMCHCNDCALLKCCPNGILDQFICLQVHGSRSLIQDQDLSAAQQCPSQTHKLTLTDATAQKIKAKLLWCKQKKTELKRMYKVSAVPPLIWTSKKQQKQLRVLFHRSSIMTADQCRIRVKLMWHKKRKEI